MSYWQHVSLNADGEPVSWVHLDRAAPVWLDFSRNFTEDWVHQQIRDAVGRQQTHDPAILHAVVDTFMHAMSYTWNDTIFRTTHLSSYVSPPGWMPSGLGLALKTSERNRMSN
jgi:hypothetical protein